MKNASFLLSVVMATLKNSTVVSYCFNFYETMVIKKFQIGWVGEYIVVKGKAKVKVQELVEKLKKCSFSAEATKILFLDVS